MRADIDACRVCGAPIRWVATTNGGRFPIDPAPHRNGNLRLERVKGGLEVAILAAPGTAPELYRSHLSTCPGAGSRRGRP